MEQQEHLPETENSETQVFPDSTEVPSQNNEFNWKLLSLTLIAVIAGASLVGTTIYLEQQKNQVPIDLTTEEENMVWTPPETETVVEEELPDLFYPSPDNSDVDDEKEIAEDNRPTLWELKQNEPVTQKYQLAVNWLARPFEIESSGLPFKHLNRSYEVGKISNGPLAGEAVYLFYTSGMAADYPEGLFVLNPEFIEVTEWIDDVANLPESITSTDGKIKLKKDGQLYAAMMDIEARRRWSSSTIETLVFEGLDNIPGNTLYTYNQCLFARTPSDLVVEYIIDIPFIDDEDEGSYATPEISYTKIDGTQVTGEYEIYDMVSYGCGSLCSPLKVVEREDAEFVKTGVTNDGSELFVLKDIYDERYNQLYTQKNTRAFVDTSEGKYKALDENKYSYEEFLGVAPLLYWKDTLGRWVEFVNTEFIILAEKCKPVIYLYPEEVTDLHVEVAPNIGFTKTIPEYKDGWNVTAYPDGTVIDAETGEDYEYLYWAGLVDGYPLITEGWVVAQKDLIAFFNYYLPQYGLRGKEIGDFTEYWIEDMQEAPFYAISFVEQSVIDELSPLSIDKEPDVVMRVLMSAKPLQRPIKLSPPQLPDIPDRDGFTVVEWGGVILR